MRQRQVKLSETSSGKAWLAQFGPADQPAASAMLDAMLLLNAEHVSQALRTELRALGGARPSRKRRLALYAERKLGGKPIFSEAMTPDRDGKLRRRAFGKNFAPVAPIRGGTRVGSEATIANVFSQVVGAAGGGRVFVNSPGPDRLRGKSGPTQTIVLVTDLIGSGKRILSWLDALWKIKSVRSWVSLGLIDFAVVAVVSTKAGEAAIRRHRLKPDVRKSYVAPVIAADSKDPDVVEWRRLIATLGPSSGRGAARAGFGGEPCLVAFSYRIPNNTPALIHEADAAVPWTALYEGGIPDDLAPAFRVRGEHEVVAMAVDATGVILAPDLSLKLQRTVLVLAQIKGRLKGGQSDAIAQQTQMPLPDVEEIIAEAKAARLLDDHGRLTDAGQATVRAGQAGDRKRPVVPTTTEPYYPMALRVPSSPV